MTAPAVKFIYDKPNKEFVARASNSSSVVFWYNRQERSWVVQARDANGHEIGDADYVYTRGEAEKLAIELFKLL